VIPLNGSGGNLLTGGDYLLGNDFCIFSSFSSCIICYICPVRLTIAILFGFCCMSSSVQTPVRKFLLTGRAQGTTYQILYYATDSTVTKKQVDSVLDKIDSSLSLYKSYSLINRFNQSDSGIAVDDHFIAVVKKSIDTYHETQGIFDITVQPLVQAWGFGVKSIDHLPDSEAIRVLKKCLGSELLEVDPPRIFKKKPCIKIDLNGIAQGYSVDVLAGLLEKNNLRNYMVELGGEIRVKGTRQPGNEKMRIGIESPGNDEFQMGFIKRVIEIDNGAVTTSGNYHRYYESEGKKITHIIDPRTGYPVSNELISVTVFAKDAITADAFDNAIMVMGLKKGLDFVNQKNDIAAHFIYRTKNGVVKDTMSKVFYHLMRN
jgi:FAD:protein FMN transferase